MILFLFFVGLASAAPQKSGLALQNYSKGVEFAQKKKYDEAVEKFQLSIELNPGLVDSYIELARAKLLMGQRKAAVNVLNGALKSLKRRDEIEKIYRERENITEIFFTNETFQFYQNGLNQLRLENANAAMDAFDQALKKEPDNVLVLLGSARAMTVLDHRKDALENLEQAIALNDRNEDARVELAEAYLAKKPKQSLELLQGLYNSPKDERVAILYARALVAQNRGSEALDYLKNLADSRQNWILVHFWLGKFFSEAPKGNWNARKHLMTFMKRTDLGEGKDSNDPLLLRWKSTRAEAENLLDRVNRTLE